ETEPEIGDEDDGPAAEPVGQCAEQRREQELHQRPHGGKQPDELGGARGVAGHEALDQPRQHRDHHAERQHVEQDGDKDERERGLAGGNHDLRSASPCKRGISSWTEELVWRPCGCTICNRMVATIEMPPLLLTFGIIGAVVAPVLLARHLRHAFPDVWEELGCPEGYQHLRSVSECWRDWKAN